MKHKPYSHSKIDSFEQCPKKFSYRYIEKIEVETNHKHFEKGSYIHEVLEKWPNPVKDFKFELCTPEDEQEYNEILDNFLNDNDLFQSLLTKDDALKEHHFHIYINEDNDFTTEKIEGRCVLRGYIDYFRVYNNNALVIDWKTGKVPWEDQDDQLRLYALWVFLEYPEVDIVRASFSYVAHKKHKKYYYHREDIESLKELFYNKINNVEKEEDFSKRPNKFCKWCDYYDICKPHGDN